VRRRLLKKRLRNLTILVGRYYLDHYGISNSAKVIRALLGYAGEGLLFFLALNFAFLFALGALAFAFQVARGVSQHA